MEKSSLYVENTHFLEQTHYPELMQQFLEQQLLEPVIEVHVVKVLDNCGLEIGIPSTNDPKRTSLGSNIQRKESDSWTNCIPKMSDIISPARNYSLNMKTQKKANFAWCSPGLAQGNVLQPLLQVILAAGNWMRTLSAFLPAQRPCSQKELFTRRKGSGKLLLPIHRTEDIFLSTAISKLVTRLVRHYDPEERQSDAAVHWDTIRPKLRERSRTEEHKISQKEIGFDTSMKEVTSRGSSIVMIPKNP